MSLILFFFPRLWTCVEGHPSAQRPRSESGGHSGAAAGLSGTRNVLLEHIFPNNFLYVSMISIKSFLLHLIHQINGEFSRFLLQIGRFFFACIYTSSSFRHQINSLHYISEDIMLSIRFK